MSDLYVCVESDDDYYSYDSKVYAIDPVGHKFLVVKESRYFNKPSFTWVDTKDCEFIKEE